MVVAFGHITQGLVFLSPGHQRPEVQHALLEPVQIGNGLAGGRIDLGRLREGRAGAKDPQQKDCWQRGGGSRR